MNRRNTNWQQARCSRPRQQTTTTPTTTATTTATRDSIFLRRLCGLAGTMNLLRRIPVRASWRAELLRPCPRSCATCLPQSRLFSVDTAKLFGADPINNITAAIVSKINQNLHQRRNHPLGILTNRIRTSFEGFSVFDAISPVVSVDHNFDKLLIPPSHVSRRPSDTYYVDKNTLLRTHTSAHQYSLLSERKDPFLVVGDVYRRDAIDRTHYPVFHQCEGIKVFPTGTPPALVERDLKSTLQSLCQDLFGTATRMRWVDAYFPFTEPSFELEVEYEGRWMEVLGCGVIHRDLMNSLGRGAEIGWAFGLGLERLAMVLFDIADIRLFWSTDPRFTEQFSDGIIRKFVPFSRYPPCTKDISFWVPDGFDDNDFFDFIRSCCGDLVESAAVVDQFTQPQTQRVSKCYRITYRSNERTLTNEEINELQETVRQTLPQLFPVVLR